MEKQILRIIDANFNRAIEGTRVVEDILRFVYDDKKSYLQLRNIRHHLAKIFSNMYEQLLTTRNSKIDPGRKVEERKYKNLSDILISNLHRVEESLRVLEEVCKLEFVEKVLKIKVLRYKIYDIEKRLLKIK